MTLGYTNKSYLCKNLVSKLESLTLVLTELLLLKMICVICCFILEIYWY